MHAVYSSTRGHGSRLGEDNRWDYAEAHLFAFQIFAPATPRFSSNGLPEVLPTGRQLGHQIEHQHRGENGPALSFILDHPAECKGSAAEMRSIAKTCKKSVSGVGFSKGWAELALKKPPPLVPGI